MMNELYWGYPAILLISAVTLKNTMFNTFFMEKNDSRRLITTSCTQEIYLLKS